MPTRTLLAFMINSLGGRFDDVVCFIPTVTLRWEALMSHFQKVFSALHSIGFQTVAVGTDGHKTNVKFFTELSGGNLTVAVPNPLENSLPVFLIFDPVHLMKNFFNNFQRKRYKQLLLGCEGLSINDVIVLGGGGEGFCYNSSKALDQKKTGVSKRPKLLQNLPNIFPKIRFETFEMDVLNYLVLSHTYCMS